jgi:hypothetical protein
MEFNSVFERLNAELIPICHLLVLLRAHPILHISRIRVRLDTEDTSMVNLDYTIKT